MYFVMKKDSKLKVEKAAANRVMVFVVILAKLIKDPCAGILKQCSQQTVIPLIFLLLTISSSQTTTKKTRLSSSQHFRGY